ncbi:MAG: hypothetical protein ABSC50_13475 [Candidatus Bathyarchaeia archaeon]|jgi:hypothetical protein
MASHPYRLSCGRITIRYGSPSAKPQILWDNGSLVSALSTPIWYDELMPEACEALSLLFEKDVDAGYGAADCFFGSFTRIWDTLLSQKKIPQAIEHWIGVLQRVRDWETRSNKTVHKGTPYCFLGATYIFAGDYDLGLRYLYDAIEEDKRTSATLGRTDSYKGAPAYMLASLVDDPRNFLYQPVVFPARKRIEGFLDTYRGKSGSSMQMAGFGRKFLQETSLEFQKLYFVYVLLEIIKHESAWNSATPNDFANMKNRDVLFDLCLVIDGVLRERFPPASFISYGIYNLCNSKGWLNTGDRNPSDLNGNLNPMITGRPPPSPQLVVPALLDLTLRYRGSPVRLEMSWLLLAWHLRNYAAHELIPQQVLVQRYEEIVQALMNALFISVE